MAGNRLMSIYNTLVYDARINVSFEQISQPFHNTVTITSSCYKNIKGIS